MEALPPTIAEAAALLQARKLSPVELAETALARIAALDPCLNSFITVTADLALAQAAEAEAEIVRGRYRGPLHGIPLGLKDIVETAGVRTTAHSRLLADHVPAHDAAVVTRLREAGAVLLGKLACHEFAHGGPSFDLPWPPARNPWNPAHVTGGSSSGSGAAVAAGLVLGAIGTDTGGSIRNPAGLCGIAGLKPTFGAVSRAGIIPNSPTFDHCGPMAWTAEDCRLMLTAITGHDPADPDSIALPSPAAAPRSDLRGLRIGVIRHFYERDLPASAEVRAAMERALDDLVGLGAEVEEVELWPLADFQAVKITIAESELYAYHEPNLRTRPQDYGDDFRARCLPARLFTAPDYVLARQALARIRAEMEAVYARYDFLVTSGLYGPAPRLDAHVPLKFWSTPSITAPFNVMGGPALSVCCGFSASGLPLSLQIAARPGDDWRVLAIGEAYERATSWRSTRPALLPGASPAGETTSAKHPTPAAAPSAEQQVNEAAPFAAQMQERLRALR